MIESWELDSQSLKNRGHHDHHKTCHTLQSLSWLSVVWLVIVSVCGDAREIQDESAFAMAANDATNTHSTEQINKTY